MLENVTMTATLTGGSMPAGFDPAGHAWSIRLAYQGREMVTSYYTGSLAGEPTLAGVIESLTLDAALGEETFKDFCANLEYNEDSRKAYAQWEACKRQSKRIHKLLGEDYDTIAYIARDFA